MARTWAHPSDAGAAVTVPVHGPDSPIVGVLRACDRIATSDSTVLLTGPTGTGKEVFARYIHQKSPRARGHLVPVNCGAIPENLLESELFGYVRGAFTGANANRKGRVALAEGGTLFLDEIGEMPLALQVKILRVLQERAYEPVGSLESVPANFRLVAATNRDLAAEVEAGRFRRDLYYRLLVCPVELPALRDRPGDVPLLFQHFWSRRGETRPVAPGFLDALCRYDWPGNIRELENVVERLSVVAEGPVLQLEDLPARMHVREPVKHLTTPPPLVLTTAPAERGDPRSDRYEPPERAARRPADALPRPPYARAPAPPPPAREEPPLSDDFDPREAFPPVMPDVPPYDELPLARGAAEVATEVAEDDGRLAEDERDALYSALRESPIEPTRPMFAGAPPEAPEALEVPAEEPPLALPVDLPALLRRLEEAYVDAALERAGGNRKAAAELLGLQRTTLVEKLRRRQAPPAAPTRARRARSRTP